MTIPDGTFRMGSYEGDSDEKPVQSVTIETLRMSQCELNHLRPIYLVFMTCMAMFGNKGNTVGLIVVTVHRVMEQFGLRGIVQTAFCEAAAATTTGTS